MVIEPLKCTKTIRTNTEKIFTRLSKLRILYDKDLIIFIVKIIEVIRKYLRRTCFNLIKQESKKRKKFLGKNGKFSITKLLASSKFIKNAIYKVIEPEYNVETELQKINKGSITNNKDENNDNDIENDIKK